MCFNYELSKFQTFGGSFVLGIFAMLFNFFQLIIHTYNPSNWEALVFETGSPIALTGLEFMILLLLSPRC